MLLLIMKMSMTMSQLFPSELFVSKEMSTHKLRTMKQQPMKENPVTGKIWDEEKKRGGGCRFDLQILVLVDEYGQTDRL